MTRSGRLSRQQIAKLPTGSAPELLLSVQLEQAGIRFEREYRFSERKFRADFAILADGYSRYPTPSLIIEVEGGVWNRGYHVRGGGFEAGCEKQALAVIAGYRYLRVTSDQVNDGRAIQWVKQALGLERAG